MSNTCNYNPFYFILTLFYIGYKCTNYLLCKVSGCSVWIVELSGYVTVQIAVESSIFTFPPSHTIALDLGSYHQANTQEHGDWINPIKNEMFPFTSEIIVEDVADKIPKLVHKKKGESRWISSCISPLIRSAVRAESFSIDGIQICVRPCNRMSH